MLWSENCYIIGEAGSNHDGNFDQAVRLIRVAAEAKCDAVKFQCLAPFNVDWMAPLSRDATRLGLDFLATPFDVEAVRIVADYCPAIKIASPELVDLKLVGIAAMMNRPLILSTGMGSLGDIERALKVVLDQEVALLQCTTRYPTPADQVNLRAMETLKVFGYPVGLSDHSLGTAIPTAAVALGARIIEKHFTIDKSLEGPDHHYALEPDELRAMVEGIRQVEQAMGTGEKGPQEGELVESRGRSLTWT